MMTAHALVETSRKLGQLSTRRSVGRLLGAIAAMGGLAAIDRGDAVADNISKNKKKAKARKQVTSGSPGPAGPTGPEGPAGPAGSDGTPGTSLTFVTVSGERSATLGAEVGSQVESKADCGPGSTPLNCGWFYDGGTSDFDRTTTQVEHGFFRGVGYCSARLRRTATVGVAGGQIFVTAICTR